MAKVNYAVVKLRDGLYDDELREKLGTYFDTAVNCYGMRGQEAADILMSSGLARQLEALNPRFVAGLSGTEMLIWAREACGMTTGATCDGHAATSPDYWTGYMLGLFQLSTGCRYARVFECMSYADLREMHSWCQNLSEDEVVDEIARELARREQTSALRRIRKAAGFSQAELAQRVGISLRAIQQYEEGKTGIQRAAAGSVYRMALVLGCTMEDLLG